MFIVLLKLTENKHKAADHMEAHKAWIARGFDDGVFLLVGTLQPGIGGGILADNVTRDELEHRIAEDPFVEEEIAAAEILEMSPARADDRLQFLLQ